MWLFSHGLLIKLTKMLQHHLLTMAPNPTHTFLWSSSFMFVVNRLHSYNSSSKKVSSTAQMYYYDPQLLPGLAVAVILQEHLPGPVFRVLLQVILQLHTALSPDGLNISISTRIYHHGQQEMSFNFVVTTTDGMNIMQPPSSRKVMQLSTHALCQQLGLNLVTLATVEIVISNFAASRMTKDREIKTAITNRPWAQSSTMEHTFPPSMQTHSTIARMCSINGLCTDLSQWPPGDAVTTTRTTSIRMFPRKIFPQHTNMDWHTLMSDQTGHTMMSSTSSKTPGVTLPLQTWRRGFNQTTSIWMISRKLQQNTKLIRMATRSPYCVFTHYHGMATLTTNKLMWSNNARFMVTRSQSLDCRVRLV